MIVIDCAAIVDALTTVDGSEPVRAAMRAHDLHAPSLLDYEMVSALRGLVRRGRLSLARAQDAMRDFDDLPIRRWQGGGALRQRAFDLRDSLSAYDAAYVALAEALQCSLVTRDKRMASANGHSARVVVI